MKTSEVLELPYGIVYGIEGDQTNNADDARACGVHGARVRCKSIYHGEAALLALFDRPGYGDFDFASPDLNFYAGVSGMNWKRRPV